MNNKLICEIVNRYEQINAAYLYGSAAIGKLKPYSDIDLAVLLVEPFSREDKDVLLTHIICDLEAALHRQADVKVLNTIANLPLVHEILSTGILLCDRQPEWRRRYTVKKNLEYLDFLYHYERMLNTYAERLRARGKTKSSAYQDCSNPAKPR